MREQAPNRRRVLRALDVLVERVLEIESALVAQLHHGGCRERLRDRAEAILRIRRRLAAAFDIRGTDRRLPGELAVAHDRHCDARGAVLALLGADELLELGRERLRRGH
jgi:hypothetical protein